MNLKTLIFITKRLVLSPKDKGIVHTISVISLIGVAVGSFAMVVVLSVFNGFTDVAKKMLEKNNPPLIVESAKGKQFDSSLLFDIANSEKQFTVSPVIKTTAMVSVGNQRTVVTLMGIDETYFQFNALDTCITNGKSVFDVRDSLFCLMGVNQAAVLGLNRGAEKMNIPVKLTVPASDSEDALILEDRLSSVNVFYQASYQTHTDIDEGTVFISSGKARQLLNMADNSCNSVYILPKSSADINQIKMLLENGLGDAYNVKTILEQEPIYFRIVKSEKLAVYIILAFIIFIASINIISAVIILHIQKKKMNKILRTIGMRQKDLRKIYFSYGMTINISGCLAGIVSGLLLCLLQQHFGLIKLAQDAFVVDAFPIKIFFRDIISVLAVVILIGFLLINSVVSRIKEKD
ncbi:MAG: ABC transporter permease [Bacteroidales bacterium]|nr:ABC transporter permease [Bacteroidales bacterium]